MATDKIPLRINMDETAVKLFQTGQVGHVTYAARLEKRSAKSLTTNVTRGQMRGMITYICFVCDDKQIQKELPQILLVNKTYATQALQARLLEAAVKPVVLWIVDKAWMSTSIMCKVLKHLNTALATWKKHIKSFSVWMLIKPISPPAYGGKQHHMI